MRLSIIAATTAGVFAAADPAAAQSSQRRVDFHGFGGWSFGATSRNHFLGADPDGNYRKTNFSFKLAAEIAPEIEAAAQVEWRNQVDTDETNLDYAFVDWQVKPGVHVRIGKAKHPFGIYSEVAGLGTARPFLNLPPSVYGPIPLSSRAYRGVGLHGTVALGGKWSVDYDGYGGQLEFESEESLLSQLSNPIADSLTRGSLFQAEHVLGVRLVVQTPIAGLRIGGSNYTAQHEADTASVSPGRFAVRGIQVEYLDDHLWIRSEQVWSSHRVPGLDDHTVGRYLETGYLVGRRWQVVAGYDRLRIKFGHPPFPIPADLLRHEGWSVGLNYWVTPAFALKSSLHLVSGNLIAELGNGQAQELFLTGQNPNRRTRLIQLGGQFAF